MNKEINNCDGCQRGLPLNENNRHLEKIGSLTDSKLCTKDRYDPYNGVVSNEEKIPIGQRRNKHTKELLTGHIKASEYAEHVAKNAKDWEVWTGSEWVSEVAEEKDLAEINRKHKEYTELFYEKGLVEGVELLQQEARESERKEIAEKIKTALLKKARQVDYADRTEFDEAVEIIEKVLSTNKEEGK